MMKNIIFNLLQIFLILYFVKPSVEKNQTQTRNGKVFSLFSVVQFPNQVCATTSGTYSNGTCITSSECSSRGGTTQGTCAAGFGVCCIFTYSETGSTISQNVSYITNPSYPSNYAPTSTPTTLTYNIEKCSCDVCRIRLDYEVFQLTTPITGNGAAATGQNGQCFTDYMTIKTTAHTVSTDTTGNIGNYPYMCGRNPGQHAYIDMSCTCTDTATLSFVLGDTTDNQWRIRVTQLSCSDQDVSNTEGCQQYFTGLTGTFSSYALDSSQMIAAQNYAYCIRPAAGYCCIEYTPVIWSVFGGTLGDTSALFLDCGDPGTTNQDTCAGAVNCNTNFIVVPGVQSQQTCSADATVCFGNTDGRERYCGSILTPTGGGSSNGASQPIITCDRPFRMFFQTGAITPGVAADAAANGAAQSTGVHTTGVAPVNVQGFQFTYRQLPGNC